MPTLIVHGTGDTVVPIDVSAHAAARAIPQATLIEYDGEPHGLFATVPRRLNADLIAFLSGSPDLPDRQQRFDEAVEDVGVDAGKIALFP